MQNYIDRSTGSLYAYDDDCDPIFILEGLEKLSNEEYEQIMEDRRLASAPTDEDLAKEIYAKRDAALAVAGIRIAPLQDAVDLNKATNLDRENLLRWKSYRIDVNRVSDQPTFPKVVDWPKEPE